jgi:hypothetical protein
LKPVSNGNGWIPINVIQDYGVLAEKFDYWLLIGLLICSFNGPRYAYHATMCIVPGCFFANWKILHEQLHVCILNEARDGRASKINSNEILRNFVQFGTGCDP